MLFSDQAYFDEISFRTRASEVKVSEFEHFLPLWTRSRTRKAARARFHTWFRTCFVKCQMVRNVLWTTVRG